MIFGRIWTSVDVLPAAAHSSGNAFRDSLHSPTFRRDFYSVILLSGHTFHLARIIGLINGRAGFMLIIVTLLLLLCARALHTGL